MNLPKLTDLDVSGKRVIVRMDLDVEDDYTRLEFAEETLDYLVSKMARLIIIGHKGRPEGERLPELSLAPIASVLGGVVGEKVNFFHDIVGYEVEKRAKTLGEGEILLLENLRFEAGEESNDEAFSKDLASLGEVYVNEAFAVSHREHASIVRLPKYLPHAAGFRFEKEVENLNKILENPKRPVVLIIGGIKEDKVEYIKSFTKIADKILVGGRLPILFGDENPDPSKVIMAQLIPDKEDITLNTIEKFKEEIAKSGTIVVAGVQGKYEDEGHKQGSLEVFNAIADSSAFKIAGGGDAEAAITEFGLNGRFDWISVGGGAMLEFLAKGTLPGIKALIDS
ncbi:MAG: Phosphoglycerate kinase [Candidatus Woesebacteria bacterium GW2011_GWA1_39_21b]|uniref:Phosphoglycerate kinase n=2 Tax=Candidatus Woeseibacteriota TaxID=1752722 RepID=A0A0G0N7B6_9BACT|nr:MAG: Phosphoglycerate kinase [Microgenomates group bacterium GW2011_GWC1_38_12]KKR12064.1 MAG: Phosphoglycerate kinase [Candidatus Woesebacteria bacterium GW2011_GWA1_39_21b]